jgi:hypothetical protein
LAHQILNQICFNQATKIEKIDTRNEQTTKKKAKSMAFEAKKGLPLPIQFNKQQLNI